MFVAKVVGSVVATEKVGTMKGQKLLVVEPYRLESPTRDRLISTGRSFVAVDTLGAGEGDFVLIVQGSSARFTPETQKLPVDCVVIGIVDSVNIEKKAVYCRHDEIGSAS
jgi:microcompartment protein CcmK/EutM